MTQTHLSKEVVEFVTVSAEYVRFVENGEKLKLPELISISQKLLSLLYLKASLLPEIEPEEEEDIPKFVTESDWNFVKNSLSKTLDDLDIYITIHEPMMAIEREGLQICLSECYADIYQDLADFLQAYRIGTEGMMNDAAWICKQNFEQFWGTRLLGLISALHQIKYGRDLMNLESESDDSLNEQDD